MKYLKSGSQIFVLILLLSFSFLVRLSVSLVGFNPDIRSWAEVSKILMEGHVVYVHTQWYNYGPVWAYILGFIGHILAYFQFIQDYQFHLAVALILSIVDVLIAFTLFKVWGKLPAVLYLLNPVSILITGYHSQFDNLAVLVGLWSWVLLKKFIDSRTLKFLYFSALLLGLSLMIKHILFFLPLWVLFLLWWKKIPLKHIIFFVVICYVIFFSGFMIEIIRNPEKNYNVLAGITSFVFQYKGSYGRSALLSLINMFYPPVFFEWFFSWTPIFKGYQFILVICLFISGFILTKKTNDVMLIFLYYLFAVFGFSPIVADQYFAIPLVGIAVLYRRVPVILFSVVGTLYLLTGPSANISNYVPYFMNLNIGNIIIPFFPWIFTYRPIDLHVQGWILLEIIIITLFSFYQIRSRSEFRIAEKVTESVFEFLKNKILILLIIFFIVVDVSILLFSYQFVANRRPMTIQIEKAYYGISCVGKGVDATKIIAGLCDGEKECLFPLSYKDPAPGCQKDFYIQWNCGKKGLVNALPFVHLEPGFKSKEQKISCPIPLYYKMPE